MQAKNIHHLLVTEGAELVGVLSARDLARGGRRGKAAPRLLVADFMTPQVVTVKPDTSVHRAANMMRGHSIGCVIVVDERGAVGIVTLADLLDHVGGPRRHRRDSQTPPDLNFRVPHKKQHRAGGAW
jgi:CBS domain-containing protein